MTRAMVSEGAWVIELTNPSGRPRDKEAMDNLVDTCGRYSHEVSSHFDPLTGDYLFRHGSNGEAALVITAEEAREMTDATFSPRLWEWVQCVHEYQRAGTSEDAEG